VFGAYTEPIFLRGPAGELTQIALSDAALAVSDADSQRRPAEHQGYYIRDRDRGDTHGGELATRSKNAYARRGGPSPQRHADASRPTAPPAGRYAAVVAKEAVIADALTKCVLLCPHPTAERVLKAFEAAQPVHQ
jgi:hypothetical protein